MRELPQGTVTLLFTRPAPAQGLRRCGAHLLGLLWGAAEKEGESLPRWPDERARRGGRLLEEEREAFAAACDRGRGLDLWDAAEIARRRGA